MVARLFVFLAALQGSLAVESLRFLAVGDWGGLPTYPYDTPIETSVAKQMAKVTDMYKTSFNLALGDNFYFDGVKDVHDKRFTYTFENVYHYDSLMNPWYLVAGNHDHNGNVSAQIAYSAVSKRWNFPDFYYNLSFPIPGGKILEILMIDTVLLCGNTRNDVVGDQPKRPDNYQVADDQWKWIETHLEASTADYLLVAGHFPVYSIAEHGPTDCLLKQLKPMLYKYNVTAYLSGHDHNIQHLRSTEGESTVNYFVTGQGNFCDKSVAHQDAVPKGSLLFHRAELTDLGGFSYIEATPNNMTMIFVNGFNTPLYSYTMKPRK